MNFMNHYNSEKLRINEFGPISGSRRPVKEQESVREKKDT
jgi:hypothetical protein